MFYDDPIDRYHSQPFSYHADTENVELKGLCKSIWLSFGDDTRSKIDGSSNNKGKMLGKDYLHLSIIQLFIHWKLDPTLCLATPRGNDVLNVRDFYNTKQISTRKLVKIFDALIEYEYVDHINHSHSDDPINKNTTSRIRTSKKLHNLFIGLEASEFDVDLNSDSKQILLTGWEVDEDGNLVKDKNNKKLRQTIEYDKNELHISAKLKILTSYNQLLKRTHVDIASLNEPNIIREKRNKTTKKIEEQIIPINQNNKFVKRIFSRGEWVANGRFYGGFWQQVGSEYRKHIRINGLPTVELDYSSLHPNILLVEQGYPPSNDVYTLSKEPIVQRFDLDKQRSIIKLAVLMLLNADNINKAYWALKNSYKKPKGKPIDPRSTLTIKEFNLYREAFINKHPPLEDLLGKDQGIRLMYKDSQVMEHMINNFTQQNITILSVHDSILIEEQHTLLAHKAMKEATKKVIGIELDFDQNRLSNPEVIGSQIFRDRDYYLDNLLISQEQRPIEGTKLHKERLDRFNNWIQQTNTN